MRQLFSQVLKEVFWSLTPSRAQLEAMIKLDFRIGNEREQWMQLCFSALASWPLFVILSVLYFDPTKNLWSLQGLLPAESSITFWLLDGRMPNILIIFVTFFLLEWIFRSEYFFISIVFYFLAKSDLHFHLALGAVYGTLLSRLCYFWWLHIDLQSYARKIWKQALFVQLACWLLATATLLFGLDYLRFQGFFAETMSSNRSEMLIYSLLFYYFFQFVFAASWGHFKYQVKKEPMDFPVNYSTATWILRFKMRPYFRKILQEHVEIKKKLHQTNLEELQTIKDLSPVSIPYKISQILQSELSFLKMASSRLTIE